MRIRLAIAASATFTKMLSTSELKDQMDKETIRNIIYRLGMYVNPISETTIVSFIHGYETGLKNTVLTDQISSHLTDKYKIVKPEMGFPYQIKVYSEKHELSWVEGFVKIVEEVLQLN